MIKMQFKFFQILRRISLKQKKYKTLNDKGRSELKSIFSKCPFCEGPLDGHEYWLLSSVVMDPAENSILSQLRSVIENENWLKASSFKEGDMTKNLVQYYFLRCNNRDVSLLEYFTYSDIWLDDEVATIKKLAAISALKANDVVNHQWQHF